MAGMRLYSDATLRLWLGVWFFVTCFCVGIHGQETFTNSACRAVTTQMASCAKRWDSIRLACKDKITTNTIWPGPCECSYYANDLPCFDEQAFCASQVWTQVPQWFRDGVSSCLMKDASYTIRAQLGSEEANMGNPFTVKDLPGRATRTINAAVATGTPAQTGAGASLASPTSVAEAPEGLSKGAKAGFGVGIGVGTIMVAVVAFLIVNYRRKSIQTVDMEAKRGAFPAELHNSDTHIHQLSSTVAYPKTELSGQLSPRYELGVRASTWLVELPIQNSNRNSKQPT
ncbi:hypothetical protein GQ44DRAFT_162119 [Phaeosphaeriaceae sp. PMI808]|nr:hypothetical protein GQ44DRAFT_162119 [Phaeosphaeriaceae sp. PMI808]